MDPGLRREDETNLAAPVPRLIFLHTRFRGNDDIETVTIPDLQ
jgi:predicted RNase H-like HicB family nuclease